MSSAVDQSLFEVAPSLGATGTLALRRAWPRGGDLTLEYESTEGEAVAAQWSAQPERVAAVARKTECGSPPLPMAVLEIGGGALLIQEGGADRRLPGLAATVARPHTTLISHRAERRATVRLDGRARPRYRKFVPAARLAGLVAAAEHASALSNGLTTPELLEVDEPAGAATFSALGGAPLHELLARGEGEEAAIPVGEALRAFHGCPPPDGLPHHTARDEIDVLVTWIGRLEAHSPSLAAGVAERATDTVAALGRLGTDNAVPVHRDLHDKQVFVDEAGEVGLLDFDLLALGEQSLDLANLLVHFDLRALQGLCTSAQARSAAEGLLAGYEPAPEILARAATYADATRLRLACVYAFRPRSSGVVERLLSLVGDGLLAGSPLNWLAPTET